MKNKLLISLLFLPFAAVFAHLFLFTFGESFSAHQFEHGFCSSYPTEVSESDYQKIDHILAQPLHFLGQGKQMTAFETADGQYVLKVFNPLRPYKKNWYCQLKNWKRYVSIKWVVRERLGKNERLKKLFERHAIAFKHLRNETGLVFVHLASSERINHLAHVRDVRGKMHILALHDTPFVIQEKATLVPKHLQELKSQEERQSAATAIEDLLVKRVSLGIVDRIQTMENNYGFVGNKPIQIDVGRIHLDPQIAAAPEEEQKRISSNLRSWLKDFL